jgi:hypothetical protein
MQLDCTQGDASLENYSYHALSSQALNSIDDAEARFERGRRLLYGLRCPKDETTGWHLISRAAAIGHPVALAACLLYGKFVTKDEKRGIELYRSSAERGHPAGNPTSLHD